VKFIVINFHYEGGDIIEQFDTEAELNAWLKENRPSGISRERFLVIKGEVFKEVAAPRG